MILTGFVVLEEAENAYPRALQVFKLTIWEMIGGEKSPISSGQKRALEKTDN